MSDVECVVCWSIIPPCVAAMNKLDGMKLCTPCYFYIQRRNEELGLLDDSSDEKVKKVEKDEKSKH